MHRGLRVGNSGTLESNTISSSIRSGSYEGKIAGLYDLEETLGRGHFAVVKLARHVFTGEKVAVKVIDKTKLDEISKAHLFQEVRCMKLVQHPNVVRLYEVIDTATKLYLILELGDGGDLYDYIMRHDTGLSEQLAKEYFRQIVRAISYCHQLHVVHRDLKPENVVFFEKLGVVKLTDFGFSNKFCPGQKLETSCGSLAYSAPEILLGDSYDAPAVDIWSLGVILYMLVCGQAPFQEANDSETLTMIMDCKYSIPSHVSKECQDLIARMLVRNPEKRATLTEIANHPWLVVGKEDSAPLDVLPLVSREQLSDEDHNLIVQKIVNGNIATKEEIQECLDKNEYNHITATYYLLAERKLRSKRQDLVNKNKRPEHLAVPHHNSPAPKRDNNNGTNQTPCLLTVPRTPGDLPQRSRKCSIVQEDEEEEDISSCTGREELAPPLNRRGSRSEGRLNLALQERLSESERRKLPLPPPPPSSTTKINDKQGIILKNDVANNVNNTATNAQKWCVGNSSNTVQSPIQTKIIEDMTAKIDNHPTTTIITDSSTITIPIITTNSQLSCQTVPKYKTMPSPTRTTLNNSSTNSPLQLNEIFEEYSSDNNNKDIQRPRQFISNQRNQTRTTYEQRRSKFHKARTASCSSSDASDDDSEKRKKRAHKLNNSSTTTTTSTTKPFQGRRDSHDDSSDSQEPGSGSGVASSGTSRINNSSVTTNNQNTQKTDTNNTKTSSSNNSGGGGGGGTRKSTSQTGVLIGRRHKASRRRNGETRLRESQSLNRITEVQEDSGGGGAHALVISTNTVNNTPNLVTSNRVRSIGAKILQGLTIRRQSDDKTTHISRKDTINNKTTIVDNVELIKDNLNDDNDCNNKIISTKKMRLLGKYFQVHKKLCIPLPGIFNRNRLYKAQSCSSLSRDKITLNTDTMLHCRQRAVSVIRSHDNDINDNQNDKNQRKSSTVVQLNNVCNELTGICAIHLGQASKCCSFC